MTPAPAQVLTEAAAGLCLLFTLLVPFAAAGLAVINAGLGRSRNAAHMMLSSLCVFALAAVVFFVVGFAFQGYPGGPAYEFVIRGKSWNWIAANHFFFRGLPLDGSPASLAALLGMMSVGLAAIIPLGSGADRWRLGAACLSTTVFAAWTYPLFAHWVWSGWLAQLGTNYGLGQGFIDVGGAAPIQVAGGISALAVTWVLRPRRGKYTSERMPMAIPGHNAVLVLLGCFLVWLGWIGLDCAGAILFARAEAGRSVLIVVNATLAAAGAMLAVAAITRIRFGKPDASLCANGWVSGLVASSAGCAVMPPAAAMLVGLIAGALVTYTVELLELLTTTLKVDYVTTYTMIAIALAIGALMLIGFGKLSDAIGRKKIIMTGLLLALLTYMPIFRGLTRAANPALADAMVKSPVVLSTVDYRGRIELTMAALADAAKKIVLPTKATSETDKARNYLNSHGIPFTLAPQQAANAQVTLSVNGVDVPGFNEKAYDAALAPAGYPKAADPAAINKPMVIGLLTVLLAYVAMVYGPIAAFLVELFPTRIRYTSMSLPYHIGNGWFGGFLPLIAASIVVFTGDIYAGLWFPIIVAAMSFVIGCLVLPETKDRDLRQE